MYHEDGSLLIKHFKYFVISSVIIYFFRGLLTSLGIWPGS